MIADNTCTMLSYSLSFGAKDATSNGEVSRLQRFLARDGAIYPEGDITGYFGLLTQKAVQRFQARYDIVNSGSPATTGYGSVGARTRAAIAAFCNSNPDTGLTTSDIRRITITTDESNDSADVEVDMRTGSDINFEIDSDSRSEMISSVGDELEDQYDFDFSNYSSDSKRDSKLRSLIKWEVLRNSNDDGDTTIDDIRDITVTTDEGSYAAVEVDMRSDSDMSDFSFDIVSEARSKMVTAVSKKLENTYNFNFDEFTSARQLDREIEKLISFETTVVPNDSPLTMTGSLYGGCAMTPRGCPTFTLDANGSYVMKTTAQVTCLSLDCKPAVTEKKGVLSSSLQAKLKAALDKATLEANARTIEYLTSSKASQIMACNSHVDGTDYSYKITRDSITYTFDTCGTVFGGNASLQALLRQIWSEMQEGTVTPTPSSYTLDDVKSVTYVEDQSSCGTSATGGANCYVSDAPVIYTVTLKTGVTFKVKIAGMIQFSEVEKQFHATGYTGDVAALLKMAVKQTPAGDLKLAVKSLSTNKIEVTFSRSTPCTPYTIDWGDGKIDTIGVPATGVCVQVINTVKATHIYETTGTFTVKVTTGNKSGTYEVKVTGIVPQAAYGLDDVKSVASKQVDPIPQAIDDEYTLFTVTLKDGTTREFKRGWAPYETFEKAVRATGYTGDIAKLLALVKSDPTPTPVELSVKLVSSSTKFALGESVKVSWPVEAVKKEQGMYIALINNLGATIATRKVPTSTSGSYSFKLPKTTEFCNQFFSDALGQCGNFHSAKGVKSFTLSITTFTPKNACFGYCAPQNTKTKILQTAKTKSFTIGTSTKPVVKPYALADVKSITSKKVDPTQNAVDDEYTLYTVTLKDQTKREFKRGSNTQAAFEKAVRATGYTGDIAKLIAKAKPAVVTSAKPYALTDVKSVVSKVIVASNAAPYTLYTVLLKDGTKHEVKVTFSTFLSLGDSFKATGYTGDVVGLLKMTFLQGRVQGDSTTNVAEELNAMLLQVQTLNALLNAQ